MYLWFRAYFFVKQNIQYSFVTDGEIYAMGGFNGRTRMSSVEKYNPNKNQWELMPSMNKQRSDASAATLNGKESITSSL